MDKKLDFRFVQGDFFFHFKMRYFPCGNKHATKDCGHDITPTFGVNDLGDDSSTKPTQLNVCFDTRTNNELETLETKNNHS